MRVLFSVISGSDPWRNDHHDGPILNIVRKYRPDYVYLFCTTSIWEGDGRIEGRKYFNWEKYLSIVAQKEVVVKIWPKDIDSPHDFDAYKDLFHSYIEEIKMKHRKQVRESNYDTEFELLLNISSGTPQMQSALCLEFITYPKDTKCIQVSMPQNNENKISGRDKKVQEIDAETLKLKYEQEFAQVELIEKESVVERTKEVAIYSFKKTMIENQLRELIRKHDYHAALSLLKENKYLNFSHFKAIQRRLIYLNRAIQTYIILPKIEKKYSDEEQAKVIFHFNLLKLALEKQDNVNVLIRAKSLAEYIVINYILQLFPDVFCLEDRAIYRLNVQHSIYEELKNYYQKKEHTHLHNFVNLSTCIAILNIKAEHISNSEEIIQYLSLVDQLTYNRNLVAHRLEKLTTHRGELRAAVNAIKSLLYLIYPIEDEDIDFIKQYVDEIEFFLSK